MSAEFIEAEEAAALVGVSPATMAQLRFRGGGPKFYKPTPRKVLYRRSDVIEWIEASARTSTAAAAR